MSEDKVCKRCGFCCFWIDKETGKRKKCKHLVYVGTMAHCRHYKNRIGRKIGVSGDKDVRCVYRKADKKHYEGCPYNDI